MFGKKTLIISFSKSSRWSSLFVNFYVRVMVVKKLLHTSHSKSKKHPQININKTQSSKQPNSNPVYDQRIGWKPLHSNSSINTATLGPLWIHQVSNFIYIYIHIYIYIYSVPLNRNWEEFHQDKKTFNGEHLHFPGKELNVTDITEQ